MSNKNFTKFKMNFFTFCEIARLLWQSNYNLRLPLFASELFWFDYSKGKIIYYTQPAWLENLAWKKARTRSYVSVDVAAMFSWFPGYPCGTQR